MDAIASAAGVSKLTLYSHFKDKEALFVAAVKTTCETRLPRSLFVLEEGRSIRQVLLDLGHALHELANSPESIGLHRAMVAMATQNPALSRMLFDAGPQRLLQDLEQLLAQANAKGLLEVAEPARAAEHFCALLKGGGHLRILVGCDQAQDAAEARRHVEDVVALFIRAYRPL